MSLPDLSFPNTTEAAATLRRDRWALVTAIATDAADAGLKITSLDSQWRVSAALDRGGHQMTDQAVKALTVLAKFDTESTPEQRDIWRRYGSSLVERVAKAGWSQADAADFLDVPDRRTWREINDEIRSRRSATPEEPADLNELWIEWLKVEEDNLHNGFELNARIEQEQPALSTHAWMARAFFQEISGRAIDAELRQILEAGGATDGT